ncbi:hypothetical protein PoB_003284100 [Plakobranchus ocellatus]|uniref:Uncharacterized protein n=1 Tax=Plakobranchus ocellatus TaxID=259542 RepID=A0AAV4AD89_9GAST|nr:hypothetical protein PoB_003284100 [Plakobranchus ocellatus]
MSKASSEALLIPVGPKIYRQDTNFRKAITARERLLVTLRQKFDDTDGVGDEGADRNPEPSPAMFSSTPICSSSSCCSSTIP